MKHFEKFPIIRLLTLASLSAPLIEPLHASNLVIDLYGPCATGKTLAARHVARMTGAVLADGTETIESLTRHATENPGRMLVIDNADCSVSARRFADAILDEEIQWRSTLLLVGETPNVGEPRGAYLRCGESPWSLRASAPAQWYPDLAAELEAYPEGSLSAADLASSLLGDDFILDCVRKYHALALKEQGSAYATLATAAYAASRLFRAPPVQRLLVSMYGDRHLDQRLMEILAIMESGRE